MSLRITRDSQSDYSRVEKGVGNYTNVVGVAGNDTIGGAKNFTGTLVADTLIVNNLNVTNLQATTAQGNTVAAAQSFLSNTIRPPTGTEQFMAPATNSAAGSINVLVTPSTGGWSAGGGAQLTLDNVSFAVQVTNGVGLNITPGMRIGASGQLNRIMGYFTLNVPGTTVVPANSSITLSISFSPPAAYNYTGAYINMPTGSAVWDSCIVQLAEFGSGTPFTITITNPTAQPTTGPVTVGFLMGLQ